ncbi:MAG: mechanosensitive ion channel [Candidatus Heimdallarchaeota archaeon]|nr:mechanosensitive ion channel [Candidatus Heimdallarchaeota archaeon]
MQLLNIDIQSIWAKVLIFFLSVIIIWVLGIILKKRIFKMRQKLGPETIGGINLIISSFQFIAIILTASYIFEIDSSAIIGLSALFGTGIGFAMAVVIGNIVAGFYLISVRPFGIGDLIIVKGVEGIVLEIGLNYSKLLAMDRSVIIIPNKSLLDANLINCSLQMDDLQERAEKGFEIGFQALLDDMKDVQLENKNFTNEVVNEVLGGKEIVRYPFTVDLKLNIISPDIPLSVIVERMDDLCRRWDEKVGYRPRYYFGKYVFRQNVSIILVVDNPHQIIELQPKFLEDLYVSTFIELQEGAN